MATSILSKHLKARQWRRNFDFLISNITAVHIEIKPSFLWDVGPRVTAQTVANLIWDLKVQCSLSSNVFVMKVKEDVFVINLKAVICNLKSDIFKKTKFIDVSMGLTEPITVCTSEIDSCIKPLIKGLLEQLEMFNETRHVEKLSNYFDLKCHGDWCVPCIFGILLNYPSVYWSKDPSDNCLSNWPLSLSKVSAMYIVENFSYIFNLYSFSTPSNLINDEKLNEWFQSLTSVFDTQPNKFFSCMKLSTEVVSYPILVL